MWVMTSLGLVALFSTLLFTGPVSSQEMEILQPVQSQQFRHLLRLPEVPVENAAAKVEEKPNDIVAKEIVKSNDNLQLEQKLPSGPLETVSGSVKKIEVEGAGSKGTAGFAHGFVASLSMIIVSELGDKTFFIAAIMAMTHSRLTVLMGAITALFAMTFLSAMVGYATTVIPRALTYYISSALFAIFGLKMLREGWAMSEDEGKEEYEEVQADLKRREDEIEKQSHAPADVESGLGFRSPGRRFLSGILSTVFLQSLTLTFLAEWGDRSQIATIILGAREDVFGVMLGGFLGHFLCTGLAVVGGRFVAQRISVRTVTLLGGVVFLIFALSALWIGPGE
ncbi:transmembrane protein 165-like [Plakobranchus ocellatus]|uniref:GDT1 family protein n=1 Tax=Plakobranchus ocellatus TaxID=259542 RepID=A0AAV3YPX1_9GAST|nr:transmembrane protein 165-like [Plakobranchus ocellatus]